MSVFGKMTPQENEKAERCAERFEKIMEREADYSVPEYDATFVVPRSSGYEETVAVVRARVASREMQEEEPFLKRLDAALAKWFTTRNGKKAWERSDEDFNIGDLFYHLRDRNLKRCLIEEKILKITVSVACADAGNWSFDRVLGKRNNNPLCHKCGSNLISDGPKQGFCRDQTCPYSDRKQDAPYTEG